MAESDTDGGTEAPRTFFGRLQASFFKPPARPSPISLTDEETRRRINRIDPTERKFGLAAAALAGAVALAAVLPYVLNPNRKVKQTAKANGTKCSTPTFVYNKTAHDCTGQVVYARSHWVFLLCVLIFFALTLFAAVQIGRRSMLGFAALMNGLAFESAVGTLFGLPFIVFGGWLLIRAWRVQRYGSPTATKRTAGAAPPPRAVRQPRERKKKVDPPTPTGRQRPEPSKRYTPKTPTRKRPTPTE